MTKSILQRSPKPITVIALRNVSVWLPDQFTMLADINWTVLAGEQWVVLGPNGSGKSTLLAIAGAHRFASQGDVEILGERMGQTSVWELRQQIGLVDANQKVLEWATVLEVVLTGVTGTIWPLTGILTPEDTRRAEELLALFDCSELASRAFHTCSQGERQRVRIARALMPQPRLLLLDEPSTGLDLPAREALLASLVELVRAEPALSTVMVSHHLEELPPTTSHALLLSAGQSVGSGPVDQVITSRHMTDCFGFPIKIDRHADRWSARADANWRTRTSDSPSHS